MWEGQYCLNNFFIAVDADFVQQQGDYDGHRETHQQHHDVDFQRRSHGAEEIRVAENRFKILPAYPLRPPDAQLAAVLLEGQYQTSHRTEAEHGVPDDRQNHQQIDSSVFPDFDAKSPPIALLRFVYHWMYLIHR